jgi:ABC-type lipoprotein export system ATPase subunit
LVVTHDRTMLESADRIVTIMDGEVAGITEQSPGDL